MFNLLSTRTLYVLSGPYQIRTERLELSEGILNAVMVVDVLVCHSVVCGLRRIHRQLNDKLVHQPPSQHSGFLLIAPDSRKM